MTASTKHHTKLCYSTAVFGTQFCVECGHLKWCRNTKHIGFSRDFHANDNRLTSDARLSVWKERAISRCLYIGCVRDTLRGAVHCNVAAIPPHPSICLYHAGYRSQPELTALRYELRSSKVWIRAIWSGLESPCGSQIVTPPSSRCNKQSPNSLKPCSPVEAWPNVSVAYTTAEHFHITIFITIIIESFVAKQAVCCRNTKTQTIKLKMYTNIKFTDC